MSYWPDGMKVKPILEWPGPLTRNRPKSKFDTSLRGTKLTLDRELRALGAKDVILQIAIPAGQKWRIDGFPRSDARPEHPGLILTMTTKYGPLSYPCDTFIRWECNLRAIALALEALRMVARYGVTKNGEQYAGSLAIDAPRPAEFSSVEQVRDYLLGLINAASWATDQSDLALIVRQAQRLTHPDTGGEAKDFHRVDLAKRYLTENGHLK